MAFYQSGIHFLSLLQRSDAQFFLQQLSELVVMHQGFVSLTIERQCPHGLLVSSFLVRFKFNLSPGETQGLFVSACFLVMLGHVVHCI